MYEISIGFPKSDRPLSIIPVSTSPTVYQTSNIFGRGTLEDRSNERLWR